MRKNNTALIILLTGIFLFLLLAVGSLAYAVFVNGSDTTTAETANTGQTINEDQEKPAVTTENNNKKTEIPKQDVVTLEELKKKTPEDTEYYTNLSIRMTPVHRAYTTGDLDYENTEQINEWANSWDEELNAVYKALMKKLTPSQQEELRKEQRKWIKQRDAKLSEYGDHLVNADLFYQLTMDRTYELAELYDKVK